MTTTPQLLAYWARCTDLHVHPDDETALRENTNAFRLDALIGPWMGPIKTAPVVVLTLNGGFNGAEVEEAKNPVARRWTANNLQGASPLPDFAANPLGRVWTQRILGKFGLSYAHASAVSFVNLIPYRSYAGANDLRMAERLKSARLVRDWARTTLFPEAETGRRVVVCARSVRAWGLDPSVRQRGQSLFVPRFTRRIDWMYDQGNGPSREQVTAAVHEAIARSVP
jgi:hypothetical protein